MNIRHIEQFFKSNLKIIPIILLILLLLIIVLIAIVALSCKKKRYHSEKTKENKIDSSEENKIDSSEPKNYKNFKESINKKILKGIKVSITDIKYDCNNNKEIEWNFELEDKRREKNNPNFESTILSNISKFKLGVFSHEDSIILSIIMKIIDEKTLSSCEISYLNESLFYDMSNADMKLIPPKPEKSMISPPIKFENVDISESCQSTTISKSIDN